MDITRGTPRGIEEVLRARAQTRSRSAGEDAIGTDHGIQQPRIFTFQKLLTVLGAPHSQVVQPFCRWLDARDVTMIQFKVEVLCGGLESETRLILESSPYPEDDPALWSEIGHWDAPPAYFPRLMSLERRLAAVVRCTSWSGTFAGV